MTLSELFIPTVSETPLVVDSLISSNMERFSFNLRKNALLSAESAIKNQTPVHLLTEYEKLGILFAAGIAFYKAYTPNEDHSGLYTTYHDVEIILKDEKYWVIKRPAPTATYCVK